MTTIFHIDANTHFVIHSKREVLQPTNWSTGSRICATQQVDTIETSTGRVLDSTINCFWYTADGRFVRVS